MTQTIECRQIDHIISLINTSNCNAGLLSDAIKTMIPDSAGADAIYAENAKKLVSCFMPALFQLRSMGETQLSVKTFRDNLCFENIIALAARTDLPAPTLAPLKEFLTSIGWHGDTEKWRPKLKEQYPFAINHLWLTLNMVTERENFHRLMTLINDPASDAKSITEVMIAMMPEPEDKNEVFRTQARNLITSVMSALIEMRNSGEIQLTGQIILAYIHLDNVMTLARRKDLSEPTVAALKHFLTANEWQEDKDNQNQPRIFLEQYGYARAYFIETVQGLILLEEQPINHIGALLGDPNCNAQLLAEAFISAIRRLPEDKLYLSDDAKTLMTAFIPALFELCDLDNIPLSIEIIHDQLVFDNIVALATRSDFSPTTTAALQSFLTSLGWEEGAKEQPSSLWERYYNVRICFTYAINRLMEYKNAIELMRLLDDPTSDAKSLADAILVMIPRTHWMLTQEPGVHSWRAQLLINSVMSALVEMRDSGEIQLSFWMIFGHLNLNSIMAFAKRDDLSESTIAAIKEFLVSVGWQEDKDDQNQYRSLSEQFGYARCYFSAPLRALIRVEHAPKI